MWSSLCAGCPPHCDSSPSCMLFVEDRFESEGMRKALEDHEWQWRLLITRLSCLPTLTISYNIINMKHKWRIPSAWFLRFHWPAGSNPMWRDPCQNALETWAIIADVMDHDDRPTTSTMHFTSWTCPTMQVDDSGLSLWSAACRDNFSLPCEYWVKCKMRQR